MKKRDNLLIVFSFLFLFNITYSQKSGAVVNSENNCKVIGLKVSGNYIGECKKGLAHGDGVFTYADGNQVYEGSFKKGMMHGEGVLYKFIDGQKNIDKQGIWKDNNYIGEKRIAPYSIKRTINLDRNSVRKTEEGNEVAINFYRNGARNNVRNLNVSSSSGKEVVGSNVFIINDIIFPFRCEIFYDTINKLGSSVFEVRFEIEINEPGKWDISLYN